jgi:hypothetical protein
VNRAEPPLHPAAWPVERLLAECDVKHTRRGGPGGQHRNKVETAVVITHRTSGAIGQGSETRSQDTNRQAAVQRLRVNLALQIRSAIADCAPSELWQSRAGGGKLHVSAEHADFPALLAEALDALAACDGRLADAAARLGVTASQLTKLLKTEPRALAQLNAARRELGLRPLV